MRDHRPPALSCRQTVPTERHPAHEQLAALRRDRRGRAHILPRRTFENSLG